jgi:hypothetical protein
VFSVARSLLIAATMALSLTIFGCQKSAEPEAPPANSAVQSSPQPSGGGGGGIAPMGPNVGGITPVAGAESVGGSGGGSVGSAAKDMAKRTAAGAGAPAGMGQMGSEGTE